MSHLLISAILIFTTNAQAAPNCPQGTCPLQCNGGVYTPWSDLGWGEKLVCALMSGAKAVPKTQKPTCVDLLGNEFGSRCLKSGKSIQVCAQELNQAQASFEAKCKKKEDEKK